MTTPLLRCSLALAALALFSACRFAPLPYTVDLLQHFPEAAEGSFAFTTPTVKADLSPFLGEYREGSFTLPGTGLPGVTLPVPRFLLPPTGAFVIDFAEVELPGAFEEASVDYRLVFEHGGNLGGWLELQLYLAPVRPDAIDQEHYALGEAQVFDLTETSALFEDSMVLSEVQLAAIAEGRLRLALALSGEVSLDAAGETTLRYGFEALELNVRSLTAPLDELLPDAEGELLDFSAVEAPGPGGIVSLTLDYDLILTQDGPLEGSVIAQVYVAPPGEDSLWQDQYAFGPAKHLDLAESEIRIVESGSLGDGQLEVLNAQALRAGVRVTGEPTVRFGEEGVVRYRFNRLLLRLGYAL
jgi:hypothetical protein